MSKDNLFRVVNAYLSKVAVPAVALPPGKVPDYPNKLRPSNNPAHRNYWNFLKEHEVELSDDEGRAVATYRSSSRRFNTYLRTGEDPGIVYFDDKNPVYIHESIKHLDNAIAKSWMKRPIQLWRGINFKKGEPITEKLNSLGLLKECDLDDGFDYVLEGVKQSDLDKLTGFRFKEPAFCSSSMSKEFSMDSQIRLLILLDRGQTGLVLNSYNEFDAKTKTLKEEAGKNSYFAAEHELLLPRDTVFQVEKAIVRDFEISYDDTIPNQLTLKVRVLD